MSITVPKIEDPDFIKLEKLINSEFEAIEILTEIEDNNDELDCFNIVKEKVNSCGGNIILGWQIWKSSILIEAEAHAIWEDENNELHDISPKGNNFYTEKILFIQDQRLKYEGKQIDNIRLNINSNELVDHFIEVSKLFFYFQNKGNRAEYHDLSEILNVTEINEIEEIYRWKSVLELYIYHGNTVINKCFCGSMKQYDYCHGKDFYEMINRLKK